MKLDYMKIKDCHPALFPTRFGPWVTAVICLLYPTAALMAALPQPTMPPIDYRPELVDGVGKWYVHAATIPGYHYQLEQLSPDAQSWQPTAFWYGSGRPLKHFVTDGPMPMTGPAAPPPANPAASWQFRWIPFKLEIPAHGASGPIRLSREATHYSGNPPTPVAAWDEILTNQNLPPMAPGTRWLLFQTWEDREARIMWHSEFEVAAYTSPASVPADSLPATPEQSAELQVYQKVKEQVIGGLTALSLPTAPPPPSIKKILRLRRTTIDANFNGVADWWELDQGFNPFAQPGQPGYFDPMGDADGDGISNRQEFLQGTDFMKKDTDGDGSPDNRDTAPLLSSVHPPVFDTYWRGMGGQFSPNWTEPQQGWSGRNWDIFQAFFPSIAVWTTPSAARSQLEPTVTWPADFTLAQALPDAPSLGFLYWNSWDFEVQGQAHYGAHHQAAERLFRCRRDFAQPWQQEVTLLRLVPQTHTSVIDVRIDEIAALQKIELPIPANQTSSAGLELSISATDPAWQTAGPVDLLRVNYLTELHRLPPVLPVNSNFDEGIIESSTGYAKPDSSDDNLRADRAIPWRSIEHGDLVTTDLHQGWFGIRPDAFPFNPGSSLVTPPLSFYHGASIKIKKLAQNDPDTDAPESGHIRLWITRGDGQTAEAWPIDPYDRNNPAFTPAELVGLVYGPNATIPAAVAAGLPAPLPNSTRYWIEGLTPGKCTLEFTCVRGSHTITHTQAFLVATEKPVEAWHTEVLDQIRLQTFVKNGKAVDLNLYHPGNGFRNTSSSSPIEDDNTLRVLAIYYYYRQLFQQNSETFMWAGMAKTAAAPIYAGMSDLTTLWLAQETAGGYGAGTYWLTRGLLCSGQKAIFTDKAWAHRAYQASGIWALNWVKDNDRPDATDYEAWDDLDAGISNQNQADINLANHRLLQREQRDVVQEYYQDFATTKWMNQPKLGVSWLDAALSWLLGFEIVTEDPGLGANVGEWLSANAKKNPMPGGPAFRSVVPGGRIDNYNDRWAWTDNATNGMLQIWTGTATGTGVPKFNAAKRLLENNKTMYSGAVPYSFDHAGLLVE